MAIDAPFRSGVVRLFRRPPILACRGGQEREPEIYDGPDLNQYAQIPLPDRCQFKTSSAAFQAPFVREMNMAVPPCPGGAEIDDATHSVAMRIQLRERFTFGKGRILRRGRSSRNPETSVSGCTPSL